MHDKIKTSYVILFEEWCCTYDRQAMCTGIFLSLML